MTGRIGRQLAGIGAFVLLSVPAVQAATPSKTNSLAPLFIRLVGSKLGAPDVPAGNFTVTVNDDTPYPGIPMPSTLVTVDFSACADIRISSNQLDPDETADCTYHTVSALTNALGSVTFTILGNSFTTSSHAGLSCATISAGNVTLSSPTVATFDLDGASGLSAADLSVCLGDIVSGTYRGRSDVSESSTLGPADLSVMLGELGTHRLTTTGPYCP